MSKPGSCSLQKCFQCRKSPTVTPSKFFLAREDAEDLQKALYAGKTDIETIINILARRSLAQRLEIISEYHYLHSADLVEDLKKNLSGDLEDLIVALMTPLDQFYAEELNRAVSGLGTDESGLIEVLCTLSSAEIKDVKRSYHKKYQRYLEDDIKDDTSGYFKDLLVSLCKTERNESVINEEEATADAEALYKADKDNRWTVFSDVLCHRSYPQLRLIFNKYENLIGNVIEKSVEDNFSGDVEEGLLAIVESVKNKAGFFAKKLYKSVAGLGTNDRDLIRVVVTRSEIDMGDIKRQYDWKFSESLASAIKDDTSGGYRQCLLILIGEAEAK